MSLGERLKSLRGTTSQTSFAEILGVSQSSIALYEKGKTPDAEFVGRVCTRFSVTADWLIFGKESSSTDYLKTNFTPEPEPPEPNPTPPQDLRDKYIACLEDLNELRKDNTDLRIEVERLRGKIMELETALADAVEEPPRSSPMTLGAAG